MPGSFELLFGCRIIFQPGQEFRSDPGIDKALGVAFGGDREEAASVAMQGAGHQCQVGNGGNSRFSLCRAHDIAAKDDRNGRCQAEVLRSRFQLFTTDAGCRASGIQVERLEVCVELVAIADAAAQEIVVSLPLVDEQFGQGAGKKGLAARRVLQEALGLTDQLNLTLISNDQAGIVFASGQLCLPVKSR